jgi:hypothetical protein
VGETRPAPPEFHTATIHQEKNNMDTLDPFAAAIDKMFALCKAQYGESIKAYWFYEQDLCPCCAKRPVGIFKFKHEDAISLNAFMYREMGVLIGYALCGACVADLRRTSMKRQVMMHERIEKHLIEAYQKHVALAN